jgi:hypothetical protein
VKPDSSGGIATAVLTEQQRNLYSIPGRARDFLSSPQPPDRLWDPPILLFNRYRELSHRGKGLKRAGNAVDSPPSIVVAKNTWSYTSPPS